MHRSSPLSAPAVAVWCFVAALGAQAAPGDCVDPHDKDCRPRPDDKERTERSSELASPQTAGDAPLPPQGAPAPPPRITRGPLSVRRYDLSVGIDKSIAPQWSLGAIIGVSRGRLQRMQEETDATAAPGTLGTISDTTVRTRSTTLGATLSWAPQTDWFVDTSVLAMRTSYDTDRLVNGLARFSGENAGRSWGLSFAAGKSIRGNGYAVIPQIGIDYVDSRVDPLHTEYFFVNDPVDVFEGFRVGPQRSKLWSGLLGVQWQWARSAGFGTWTPYLRASWRERLSLKSDPVVTTAPPSEVRSLDLAELTSRRTGTLAAGLLLRFTGGRSVFLDLGHSRGDGDVRENRLAFGFKLEI